jgi:ABC-type transporter Mla maintaining outer membrane lipid asymmetry permease subunit MlaE
VLGTPRELARFPGDFAHVFGRAWIQAFARPAAFYGVVATLLGFTVLYVISHTAPVGVRPDIAIDMVGGSYIVALTPPVAGFLFVAASGSATNAWLGGMGLTRQIAALEALGVSREKYLWAPVYAALALSFLLVALVFAGGLLVGGLLLCKLEGIHGGWQLIGADVLHPRPERAVYTMRALWLAGIYALGIAADVVAKGSADKEHSDEVTRAMTASVVASTLWVVALELISAFAVFAATGGGK